MKRLLFILLLTGCSYSKVEVDQKVSVLDKKIKELAIFVVGMHQSVGALKEKTFPEAMKVSKENNNCSVDLTTNKCIKEKENGK